MRPGGHSIQFYDLQVGGQLRLITTGLSVLCGLAFETQEADREEGPDFGELLVPAASVGHGFRGAPEAGLLAKRASDARRARTASSTACAASTEMGWKYWWVPPVAVRLAG